MQDLNVYISKRHIAAVVKFNKDLEEYARYTDTTPPVLYEDAYTYFTLWNVYLKDGFLCYTYDGKEDRERIVYFDEEEQNYYETDYEGIMSWLSFWRACMRRAKRYWEMDNDVLDKIQDGEIEDDGDDE